MCFDMPPPIPAKHVFFLIEFSRRVVSEWTASWQAKIKDCNVTEGVAGLQAISAELQTEIDKIEHALSVMQSPLGDYLDHENKCLWYLSSEAPGYRPAAWYDVDDDVLRSKKNHVTTGTEGDENVGPDPQIVPMRLPINSNQIDIYVEKAVVRAKQCITSALELKQSCDLLIKAIVEQPHDILHTLSNGRRISPRALANALEPYVMKMFLNMKAIDVALVLLGGTGELFVRADTKTKAAKYLVPIRRALSLNPSSVANIIVVPSSGDDRWPWKDKGRDTFEHSIGSESSIQEVLDAQKELIDSINKAIIE